MPVEVPCPHCQCLLKAPDGMAGKKARCKQCRATFDIPGGPPAGDDAPPPAAEANPFAFGDAPPSGRGVDKPTPVPADSPLPADDNPFVLTAPADPPAEKPAAKPRPEEKSKPKYRAEEKSKSQYRMKPAPAAGGGSRRVILVAGLVGLLCAAAGGAGVYVWMQSQTQPAAQPAPVAQADKPAPADPPAAKPEKPAGKAEKPAPKVEKPAAKDEKPAEPAKPAPPSKSGVTVTGGLPLPPPPDMVTLIQKPKDRVPLDVEAGKVRRVLMSGSDAALAGVVWPLSAGIRKTGAADAVDRYSLASWKFIDRLEVPADGLPWPRACDMSPEGNKFASEAPAGKVTVWNLNDKAKILNGVDPHPGDGKGPPGVAAVYFVAEDQLAVVSKLGAVDVWDLKARAQVLTGTPIPGVAPDRPLADQRTVAMTPDGKAVLALVGGTVYEVPINSGKPKAALSLPRNPDAGYALAADASGARVVAAYRATAPAPHAVVVVARLGDSKPAAVVPLADDMGVPVEAAWPGPETAVVVTDKGAALLIDGESNKVVATVRPAAAPAAQFPGTATGLHWCVLPDTADAKKAVLVSVPVPFEGYFELRDEKKPTGLVVSAEGIGK